MKQRFFTNTIQSNFIKALIYNTPIPLIKTVNDNSYILKGNTYLYRNSIIKCTRSGIITMPEVPNGYTAYYRNGEILILNNEDISLASSGSSQFGALSVSRGNMFASEEAGYYYDNSAVFVLGGMYNEDNKDISFNYQNDSVNKYESMLKNCIILSKGNYKTVGNFVFGNYYPKMTELYCSNIGYYDTTTHEKLGNLLRCYRDLFGINLMPYYNCVSGNYISNIVIHETRLKEEDSKDYKTFKIPIKFNTTYTLALDCNYTVNIAPVLLSNNHIIESVNYYTSTGATRNIEFVNSLFEGNRYTFNSLSFKNPVTFGITTLNKENAEIFEQYEKYLYLLIQVPKDNDSSIVLLEGDYTKVNTNHMYNIEGIDNLNDLELSNIMTTNLSLLQMSDKITYPYANRLIEYLLLAVINPKDKIYADIERIQDLFIMPQSVKGVWDNTLRSNVYLKYQKIDLARHLDLNGFVDRDTESLMNKLN